MIYRIPMGCIRITSGKLKGRKVITPEGEETRPLLTRLRKSLADTLRPALKDTQVLDLFGGSGAIAFELISNGAARAVIIEINPGTAGLINENAIKLGIDASVEVFHGNGVEAISRLALRGEKFDTIMVAPPYGQRLQQKALDVLGDCSLLASGGLVVVQREEKEPAAQASGRLYLVRTRSYGRTVFDFYKEKTSPPSCTS
jgi:16S rRNA (guanine966-N2)-methyltransferase